MSKLNAVLKCDSDELDDLESFLDCRTSFRFLKLSNPIGNWLFQKKDETKIFEEECHARYAWRPNRATTNTNRASATTRLKTFLFDLSF